MPARCLRVMLFSLLVLAPVVLTWLLLSVFLHVNPDHFVPTYYDVYNDSLHNWRQVYTFSAVGFNGGYYTVNELPAPAAFSRYYAHGPVYALLYGTLGRVFGWTLISPIILNALVITFSLTILLTRRPDSRQALLLIATTIMVWPVLIYIPTSMMESLHQAGAIVIGTLIWGFMAGRRRVSPLNFTVLIGLVGIFALMRPTWGVLFFPLLIMRLERRSLMGIIRATGLALLGFIFIYLANTALSAPYPLMEQSLSSGIQARLDRLANNLAIWSRGVPIEVAQRYLIGALLIVILLVWGIRGRAFTAEGVFHLSNLGAPLAINLLFNDMAFYRDFRALAPHLLLSLIVLVACRRWFIPAAFAVIQAVMLPEFLLEYRATIEPQFAPGLVEDMIDFRDDMSSEIVYQPDAPSGWCNTLLFILENRGHRVLSIPPELALIHPGVGLSFYIGYWGNQPPLRFPLRSQYILLSSPNRAKIGNRVRLSLLHFTPIGVLYRNEQSPCADSSGHPSVADRGQPPLWRITDLPFAQRTQSFHEAPDSFFGRLWRQRIRKPDPVGARQ